MAGCQAGVNQALLETPTPYPVRSPVVASGTPRAPGDDAPISATAEAALRAGRYATAEAGFGRALDADPGNVSAFAGRAAARRKLRNLEGAAADLDAALALAPSRADLVLLRAGIAGERADFSAALADYEWAIGLDPGNPAAYTARGETIRLLAQGDPARYQAALGDFGRALALNPEDAAPRVARARLFVDRAAFRGDPADLERAAAELDRLGPGGGGEAGVLVRARLLAAQGKTGDATRILDAPVVRSAADAPASAADRLAARAAVALADRDWDAAAEAAAAAVAASPSHWEARRALAEAHLGLEDPAGALAAAESLLAAWPDDGPGNFLIGAARLRLGRDADAAAAFDAARRRLALSPVYLARIGQLAPGGGGLPAAEDATPRGG